MMTESQRKAIRVDLQLIADMVEPGSRLLDIGCGDGELLDHLLHEKQVDGRGIELSTEGVNACVSAGLSVIQGDADTDLNDYPNQAFDYVILSPAGSVGKSRTHRQPRYRVLSQFRLLAGSGSVDVRGPNAPHQFNAVPLV